jgi:endonuclease-3
MNSSGINRVIELLAGEYGRLSWREHRDPLSELIMTVLSQNTSDLNSRRAYSSLMTTFGDWHSVAEANVEDIAEAIRSGGLARIKAGRIRQILGQVVAERGSLDLEFLRDLPLGDARAWLGSLPGVGPKTVACVLLFSLGRPVLPVDTHVHRVARRLGLIDSRASAEKAHEVLGDMVPDGEIYQFHMHLIRHGREVCRAQRPQCQRCVLLDVCPAGRLILGTTLEHGVKA